MLLYCRRKVISDLDEQAAGIQVATCHMDSVHQQKAVGAAEAQSESLKTEAAEARELAASAP